ncbi:hypothetical protein PQQ53_10265 [Paraburkholderia strydomiana]|uniref:Uncharacterized protein n=1 Tax=Paraburkholderia strydomiana TaxID=1245417 RepID=A0ABW9ED67_9BURK
MANPLSRAAGVGYGRRVGALPESAFAWLHVATSVRTDRKALQSMSQSVVMDDVAGREPDNGE